MGLAHPLPRSPVFWTPPPVGDGEREQPRGVQIDELKLACAGPEPSGRFPASVRLASHTHARWTTSDPLTRSACLAISALRSSSLSFELSVANVSYIAIPQWRQSATVLRVGMSMSRRSLTFAG